MSRLLHPCDTIRVHTMSCVITYVLLLLSLLLLITCVIGKRKFHHKLGKLLLSAMELNKILGTFIVFTKENHLYCERKEAYERSFLDTI